MNPRVAIWTKHPGDLLGEAITAVTHGPAQHAGFIKSDGRIHELYLPGVRERDIQDAERPYLLAFDIEGLTPDLAAKLERHFNFMANDQTAISYSVADLFRILLNIQKPDNGGMVCSQYVFRMLDMIGLPPLARCSEDFISPRDLLISPRLLGPTPLPA